MVSILFNLCLTHLSTHLPIGDYEFALCETELGVSKSGPSLPVLLPFPSISATLCQKGQNTPLLSNYLGSYRHLPRIIHYLKANIL